MAAALPAPGLPDSREGLLQDWARWEHCFADPDCPVPDCADPGCAGFGCPAALRASDFPPHCREPDAPALRRSCVLVSAESAVHDELAEPPVSHLASPRSVFLAG